MRCMTLIVNIDHASDVSAGHLQRIDQRFVRAKGSEDRGRVIDNDLANVSHGVEPNLPASASSI